MSIKHFENLNHKNIIDFLRDPESFVATEKIDGSQLYFGIDQSGRFYTTYNLKDIFYSADDYECVFSSNYRKFAHVALELSLPKLRNIGLDNDSLVKVEVLYGTLPNVVEYRFRNTIVFLECVRGTVNLNRVEQEFSGQPLSVSTHILTCGSDLDTQVKSEITDAYFTTVPEWNYRVGVLFEQQYFYYKTFLDKITSCGLSRGDILDLNLSHTKKYSIDKSAMTILKDSIKEENERIKLVIKETLLNHVVRNKPGKLGSEWVEGVVFKSGNFTFKLVDKSVFRKLQMFYWQERIAIEASALEDLPAMFDKYMNNYRQLTVNVESLNREFTYTDAVHKRTLEAYASVLKNKNENRRSCFNLTERCTEIQSVSTDIAESQS